MSQPVKLSDALVLDARLAGDTEERSIAGQVEFWARLGRSVDLLLEGRQVLALRRGTDARPLSACLESVDTPEGRRRVAGLIESGPFPHYQPHPERPGLLIRTGADGSRDIGRFVNRQFVASGVPVPVTGSVRTNSRTVKRPVRQPPAGAKRARKR
jgi:hypothetical protein